MGWRGACVGRRHLDDQATSASWFGNGFVSSIRQDELRSGGQAVRSAAAGEGVVLKPRKHRCSRRPGDNVPGRSVGEPRTIIRSGMTNSL